VIAAGEKNADGCDWRTADGAIIVGIDPPSNDPTFTVCLSQPELGEILKKRLLETAHAKVFFNQKFQRLEQRDGMVVYWTKEGSDVTEHTCRFLIGADGGRSTVRQGLGIHLEGHTFEKLQFIAVNFQYKLRESRWKAANFIVDPVDWGIVVKRGKGRSWRFATGIQTDNLTKNILDEATIDVVKERLCRILPGDTRKIQYEAMAPYAVHQRCASRYRDGNVLLAGDAAHVCLHLIGPIVPETYTDNPS
jgi:2-polyprenyl-6-methoxyphenol hydroxylase-like FAD-dependent oxidoreductase